MLFIHMLCLVCFNVFHVLCMCVPNRPVGSSQKWYSEHMPRKFSVYKKEEVGCHMNIKANALHTTMQQVTF